MSNTTGKLITVGIIAWLLWPKKSKASTTQQFGTLDELKLAFAPFGDTMYIHIFNMDQTVHETLVVPPYYPDIETVYAFGKQFNGSWNHQWNVAQLDIVGSDGIDNVTFLINPDGSILDTSESGS